MAEQSTLIQVVKRAVLLIAYWLSAWAGGDIVRPGWRQIPAGRIDFDPALAKLLKSSDRAIAYSMVDYWNRTNERRRSRQHLKNGAYYSYGDNTYWANNYAIWMSAKTWGRLMDDLAKAGLILKSTINDQPAYSALNYALDGSGQIVQGERQVVLEPRQVVQKDGQKVRHTIPKESTPKLSTPKEQPTTPALAQAAVDVDFNSTSDSGDDVIDRAESIDDLRLLDENEADNDIAESTDSQPSPRPLTPISAAPPSPPDGWRDFFKTPTDWELCEMVRLFGVDRVNAWIEQAKTMKLDNPGGFVVSRLKGGIMPPPKRLEAGTAEYWADYLKRHPEINH